MAPPYVALFVFVKDAQEVESVCGSNFFFYSSFFSFWNFNFWNYWCIDFFDVPLLNHNPIINN